MICATGNLLRCNPAITALRASVKKFLVVLGKKVKSTKTLTSELVVFMHQRVSGLERASLLSYHDLSSHAIMLMVMNWGLSFYEVAKVQVDDVTCIPTELSFVINLPTKNQSNAITTNPLSAGDRARWRCVYVSKARLHELVSTERTCARALFCGILGNSNAELLRYRCSLP